MGDISLLESVPCTGLGPGGGGAYATEARAGRRRELFVTRLIYHIVTGEWMDVWQKKI